MTQAPDSTIRKVREHLAHSKTHLDYLKKNAPNFDNNFSADKTSYRELSEKTTRLEAMKRAPWSIKPFNIHSKLIAPISAREVAKESEKLDLKLSASSEQARQEIQDRVLDIRGPQVAVDLHQSRSFNAPGSSANVQVGRSASGAIGRFTENQERFDDSSIISGEERPPTAASGGTGEHSISEFPFAIKQEGTNALGCGISVLPSKLLSFKFMLVFNRLAVTEWLPNPRRHIILDVV
ncbi:hypothetical protein NLI96_g7314 [Meripilus lineatus]|uniref:Uncharacterized protein n=1 Tax=Meripilus lineatus TaxID=2056292 RepID=A0AAD5YC67_9APHY|nr:hypothetical protein NLI96_g7314 [Physisporinus lineatus]